MEVLLHILLLCLSKIDTWAVTIKKMLIHMWLWTCCPFKELGGRQRTSSRRGSVKGMDSCRTSVTVSWRTYGSMCPSPPIRPLPLLPFLRKVLSHCQMVSSFLVAKSDSFFPVRVVTACRSWQPDLACLSSVSRSTDHIVDACTKPAPTISLPVSWVHIRSTLAKKNLRQLSKLNNRRVHAWESTRLCPAAAVCGWLNFFGQGSIMPTFSTCTVTNRKQNRTRVKGQLRKQTTDKSTTGQQEEIERQPRPRKDRTRTARRSPAKEQLRKQKTNKTTGNRATTPSEKRQDEDR